MRSLTIDLSTTAEDMAVLKRLRESRRLCFADYLEFLSRLEPLGGNVHRKTHEGCEPFEL